MSKTRRNRPRHWTYDAADSMSAEAHVYHASRCYNKISYPTLAKAKRAKRNKARRFGQRYKEYRCPYIL